MIEVNNIKFNVEISKKNIKNIYLRLKGTTIEVSAPFLMPEYEIYRFVETKKSWIAKAYKASEERKIISPLYRGGNTFYIFNEAYDLIFLKGKKEINIINKTIYLTYPNENEERIKFLYKNLNNKLLIEANKLRDKYLVLLKDYGYNLVPEINIKSLKSKWGVCYTRENRINLSSNLIHYSLDCLEYVVLHEMVHFIVPNHSKRFYEIIFMNLNDYKQIKDKLR